MKFWQQKWRSMNGFRRMILVVLALMLVGFGAAMAAAQTRLPFISDGEGRLTPKAEGETLVYSGQLDGGQVRLTVRPDGTAEYQWETLTYGPYQLEGSPEAPVSSALVGPNARGVTIRQGDRILFWGSYDPAPKNVLFTLVSDGAPPGREDPDPSGGRRTAGARPQAHRAVSGRPEGGTPSGGLGRLWDRGAADPAGHGLGPAFGGGLSVPGLAVGPGDRGGGALAAVYHRGGAVLDGGDSPAGPPVLDGPDPDLLGGDGMSTRPEFVQYLLDQLEGLGELRARKMFGDYLIYLNDRPALLVCDGTPFAKPLPCVAELLEDRPTAPPYEGTKAHYVLDPEDRNTLRRAAELVSQNSPPPTKRRRNAYP